MPSVLSLLLAVAPLQSQDLLAVQANDRGDEPPTMSWRVDPGAPQRSRAHGAIPTLAPPSAVPPGFDVRFHSAGASPEGDAPSGIAFTPDGERILIAHRDSRNVLEDSASGDFLGSIPVFGAPLDLAVSSDGRYAVTANGREDTASIIDLALGREVAHGEPAAASPAVPIEPARERHCSVSSTRACARPLAPGPTLRDRRRVARPRAGST
jgi:hypothetical protein